MLAYPQLSQFPIEKRRRLRTVVNRTADRRTRKLADPCGAVTEWQMQYTDLTDEEVGVLESFFQETEGTLNGFTYIDHTANLLAWSRKLDEAVWTKGPLLRVEETPLGWLLTNTGPAAQGLSQTLDAPGGYQYCLSALVESAAPCAVTLSVGGARAERAVDAERKTIQFAATGDTEAEQVTFGLEIPAGAAVEVFGVQVDGQLWAGFPREGVRGGVYQNAHLKDDELAVWATGVNRNECIVNIIHADHL